MAVDLRSVCIVHPDSECDATKFNFSGSHVEVQGSEGGRRTVVPQDVVFAPKTPQDVVFQEVTKGLINEAFDSFRSSAFVAFGPSGSGKTFAITGGAKRFADRGLIPRSISALFEALCARDDRDDFQVSVSFYELYKDTVIDLLSERRRKVAVQAGVQGPVLVGLLKQTVLTESDAYQLLFQGDSNRHFERFALNPETSRGHVFFLLYLTHLPTRKKATLAFVDLAASVSTRNHATEAITQSLGALKDTVTALRAGQEPPFQKSLLTQLLRPWLQPSVEEGRPTLVAINPVRYSEEMQAQVCEWLLFSQALQEAVRGRPVQETPNPLRSSSSLAASGASGALAPGTATTATTATTSWAGAVPAGASSGPGCSALSAPGGGPRPGAGATAVALAAVAGALAAAAELRPAPEFQSDPAVGRTEPPVDMNNGHGDSPAATLPSLQPEGYLQPEATRDPENSKAGWTPAASLAPQRVASPELRRNGRELLVAAESQADGREAAQKVWSQPPQPLLQPAQPLQPQQPQAPLQSQIPVTSGAQVQPKQVQQFQPLQVQPVPSQPQPAQPQHAQPLLPLSAQVNSAARGMLPFSPQAPSGQTRYPAMPSQPQLPSAPARAPAPLQEQLFAPHVGHSPCSSAGWPAGVVQRSHPISVPLSPTRHVFATGTALRPREASRSRDGRSTSPWREATADLAPRGRTNVYAPATGASWPGNPPTAVPVASEGGAAVRGASPLPTVPARVFDSSAALRGLSPQHGSGTVLESAFVRAVSPQPGIAAGASPQALPRQPIVVQQWYPQPVRSGVAPRTSSPQPVPGATANPWPQQTGVLAGYSAYALPRSLSPQPVPRGPPVNTALQGTRGQYAVLPSHPTSWTGGEVANVSNGFDPRTTLGMPQRTVQPN